MLTQQRVLLKRGTEESFTQIGNLQYYLTILSSPNRRFQGWDLDSEWVLASPTMEDFHGLSSMTYGVES